MTTDSGISTELLRRLAEMTRLGLAAEEVERLTRDMGAIVDHISRLQAVDTGEVPAGAHITGLGQVTRVDAAHPSLPTVDVLANAPEAHDDFFVVPAVFGDS